MKNSIYRSFKDKTEMLNFMINTRIFSIIGDPYVSKKTKLYKDRKKLQWTKEMVEVIIEQEIRNAKDLNIELGYLDLLNPKSPSSVGREIFEKLYGRKNILLIPSKKGGRLSKKEELKIINIIGAFLPHMQYSIVYGEYVNSQTGGGNTWHSISVRSYFNKDRNLLNGGEPIYIDFLYDEEYLFPDSNEFIDAEIDMDKIYNSDYVKILVS